MTLFFRNNLLFFQSDPPLFSPQTQTNYDTFFSEQLALFSERSTAFLPPNPHVDALFVPPNSQRVSMSDCEMRTETCVTSRHEILATIEYCIALKAPLGGRAVTLSSMRCTRGATMWACRSTKPGKTPCSTLCLVGSDVNQKVGLAFLFGAKACVCLTIGKYTNAFFGTANMCFTATSTRLA